MDTKLPGGDTANTKAQQQTATQQHNIKKLLTNPLSQTKITPLN